MAKVVMDYDELDCLVETHIHDRTTIGNPYLYEGERYVVIRINEIEHHVPLKFYSKSIAEAWKLVSDFKLWYSYSKEESRKNRMEWTTGNDLSHGEIVSFILIVQDGFERKIYAAEGVTLERAICLAVLRAKGVVVQDDILEG